MYDSAGCVVEADRLCVVGYDGDIVAVNENLCVIHEDSFHSVVFSNKFGCIVEVIVECESDFLFGFSFAPFREEVTLVSDCFEGDFGSFEVFVGVGFFTIYFYDAAVFRCYIDSDFIFFSVGEFSGKSDIFGYFIVARIIFVMVGPFGEFLTLVGCCFECDGSAFRVVATDAFVDGSAFGCFNDESVVFLGGCDESECSAV